MEVGIDHKPFYVDIDTGSSLTWVHCRLKPDLMSPKQGPNGFYEAENSDRIVLCNERICSIADDYHDPDDCDDADPDYCQYDLRYADNLGTKGVLVKDSVGLMLHSHQVDVELAFGCGYSQTGCEYEVGPGKLPVLRSDGILGLSKKPASIPSQLHAKRLIRYLIGHCFLPFHKRSGSHVGILLFGKSDMTTKGIRWARMIEREHMTIQSAYEGEVVQVKYGNRLVASFVQDHPERFVTFDSGTSMIWLTKGLFQALHDQLERSAVSAFQGHNIWIHSGSVQVVHIMRAVFLLKIMAYCKVCDATFQLPHNQCKPFGSIFTTDLRVATTKAFQTASSNALLLLLALLYPCVLQSYFLVLQAHHPPCTHSWAPTPHY
ncbi:hypothetical protein KC19_7G122300 [Ceratodon purpureus]|nr:hypothetical protein KC19_7G122300 [Ceratodon purpureus]KAG0567264.1 hypothetical protein KC19_7G122300 [Ceratodon purpureus]